MLQLHLSYDASSMLTVLHFPSHFADGLGRNDTSLRSSCRTVSHTGLLGTLPFSTPTLVYNSLRVRILSDEIGQRPVLAKTALPVKPFASSPCVVAVCDQPAFDACGRQKTDHFFLQANQIDQSCLL